MTFNNFAKEIPEKGVFPTRQYPNHPHAGKNTVFLHSIMSSPANFPHSIAFTGKIRYNIKYLFLCIPEITFAIIQMFMVY